MPISPVSPMNAPTPLYPTTTTRVVAYLTYVATQQGKSYTTFVTEKGFSTFAHAAAWSRRHYVLNYGAPPGVNAQEVLQAADEADQQASLTLNNANTNQWTALGTHATPQTGATIGNSFGQINTTLDEALNNVLNAVTGAPTLAKKKSTTADGNNPYAGKLLQEIYSYKAMKLRKADGIAYEKSVGLQGQPYNWSTLQGMVGIEIEVENIRHGVGLQAFWDMKADNSLRNNGAEFVSVPLPVKQIQIALEHLFKAMHQNNTPDFSNRTSIHVHVNCRDMTQDQIWNMCLLYAVFEKHFYKVAGTKRMNSIFCVPLFRTNQLSHLRQVIYDLSPAWHKYCGLNLLPLINNNVTNSYGTIEFRHLYGTSNQEVILNWINDLLCIRQFAINIKKEELESMIKEMNTTSSYLSLYSNVFAKGQRILTEKRDFEECVSNLKRELFGDEYQQTISKSDSSVYWNTARDLGIRG